MYLFLTENKLHLFINREEIKNLNFISIPFGQGKNLKSHPFQQLSKVNNPKKIQFHFPVTRQTSKSTKIPSRSLSTHFQKKNERGGEKDQFSKTNLAKEARQRSIH